MYGTRMDEHEEDINYVKLQYTNKQFFILMNINIKKVHTLVFLKYIQSNTENYLSD